MWGIGEEANVMDKLSFVLYKGIECSIKIISYPGKNTQIVFREDSFVIYINKNCEDSRKYSEVAKHLELWLREKAKEAIADRTMEYSEIIGVSYNNIRIKDTKSRWGSCSGRGNLNFSWRIIMTPAIVMDYIIIHELCHLRHLNHSKEYWKTVEQYMPDYRRHKEWLKINGTKLRIY